MPLRINTRLAACALLIIACLTITLLYHRLDSTTQRQISSSVDETAEYRRALQQINPLDSLPHSRTLGVAGKIYVIGMPDRNDRREELGKLERALDLDFTYHDATNAQAPVISDIMERMRAAREAAKNDRKNERERADALPFGLPDDILSNEYLTNEDMTGSELWVEPYSAQLPTLPEPPYPSTRGPLHVFMGYAIPEPQFPIKPVEVACWHSHFQVLQQIARGPDESAIIFEDDIDVEWDIEKRLRYLWQFLPKDGWDQVFLGHCQSNEVSKPALPGTSYLHPSTHTMCTHAYAVSKKGAARLVRMLRHPVFAYSRPIDHAYKFLNADPMFRQFSVYPAVVVQSKSSISDIGAGTGPNEDFYLVDSTLSRISAHEKMQQVL
ncbi:hypothetical protein C8R47DRAFT_1009721 [Mycena vitilis]|nr:hypothetical protein C8R47DRAFT_1009721 [Mycena vitilis]